VKDSKCRVTAQKKQAKKLGGGVKGGGGEGATWHRTGFLRRTATGWERTGKNRGKETGVRIKAKQQRKEGKKRRGEREGGGGATKRGGVLANEIGIGTGFGETRGGVSNNRTNRESCCARGQVKGKL